MDAWQQKGLQKRVPTDSLFIVQKGHSDSPAHARATAERSIRPFMAEGAETGQVSVLACVAEAARPYRRRLRQTVTVVNLCSYMTPGVMD
jgi:hypothetical protein